MKIQMPRPKSVSAIGSDRLFVPQQTVIVAKYFQCTRLLGLSAGRVVSASSQDDVPVVWHRQHLMRENPGLDAEWLSDFRPESRIGINPIYPDPRRIVKCHQHVVRRDIGRHVDWPVWQRYRFTVRIE